MNGHLMNVKLLTNDSQLRPNKNWCREHARDELVNIDVYADGKYNMYFSR